ncbi:cupin domain-containing protein [Silvimonas iriomotensis]|uniref:Cupin n=1 Tax=Silvimonas iriomotensis TaxID=449662 RepID=A0ABQ2P6T3_9NEIS|nr:cupin domain-containing protein [Silvimonas iriomotensis]GGP19685.1 cupin [Silvimonas iriomotensis]
MQINADLTLPALEHETPGAWRPTPDTDVTRRPLFRIGGEVAQATSLVRYAPGSRFHAHTHHGGEEILVIDGMFSDEHGDFPAGTYFRNPPGTRHSPHTQEGCLLLVRLWQFVPGDETQQAVPVPGWPTAGQAAPDAQQTWPVYRSSTETVSLIWLPASQRWSSTVPGGGEWLVLRGTLMTAGATLAALSWYRLPCGAALDATAGEAGVWLWAKTGHLGHLPAPPASTQG